MKTPFSSMLLVLAASVIGSIAAVLLKAGANRLRSGWRHWTGKIGAGIALFLVSSYFYIEGVNNHRLQGGGFRGYQLEIDCRRAPAPPPAPRCIAVPSHP